MSDIRRDQLQAQLHEMVLHDDTGDPHDEGYMAAVNELQAWLDRQPASSPVTGALAKADAEVTALADALRAAGVAPTTVQAIIDHATPRGQ